MSVSAALELHTRGREENARGRHAAAAELLRAALVELAGAGADSGTELARARIQLTLAWSVAELHGLDRGLEQLGKAHDILGSGTLDTTDAQALRTPLHNQHGLLLLRAGRVDLALEQFAEAERWFASAPVLERCNVLLNRGTLGIDTLDIAASRADLTRCAGLARTAELPLLEFKARHNLGYLEFLAGDLPRALAAMDEASSVDVDRERGAGLIDRARVLMEAGLNRDADDALTEAIGLLRTDDSSTHDLAEALLERARCRSQALDWRSTLASAAQARDIFLERGNRRRAASAALVELIAQVGLGADDAAVIASARSLAGELSAEGQYGDAHAAALLAARLLLESGRTEDAARLLDTVGPMRRGDRIAVKVVQRHVRAQLAFASGAAARGRREIRTGLAELAAYRARFGSIDAQTASGVHGVLLSELDLEAASRTGRPSSIFAAVERARYLSGGMAAVRPAPDSVTATLLAELRRLTVQLQGDSIAATALDAVHARRLELQREIKSREWRQSGSGPWRRRATLAEVREALDRIGAGMVLLFDVAGVVHALPVATAARGPVAVGSTAELDEQVLRVRADLDALAGRRLLAPIEAAVRRSLTRSLTALDGALIGPLRLDGRPLVIVPTGALGLLPWGMLPSLKGVPVSVAPSATWWRRRRDTDRRALRGARVAAFAGPHLDRAAEEARGVAAAWRQGASHVGAEVTGAGLREALRTADLVHVAAHGRHDADNPLFSSISLADGQSFGYDLVPDVGPGVHVVLSACELGLATIRPGDEPLGLTRALLHYGAATVVSSVARIADDTAAEVMLRHHANLALGMAPAVALAAAIGPEDTAPFVCFGAGLK